MSPAVVDAVDQAYAAYDGVPDETDLRDVARLAASHLLPDNATPSEVRGAHRLVDTEIGNRY